MSSIYRLAISLPATTMPVIGSCDRQYGSVALGAGGIMTSRSTIAAKMGSVTRSEQRHRRRLWAPDPQHYGLKSDGESTVRWPILIATLGLTALWGCSGRIEPSRTRLIESEPSQAFAWDRFSESTEVFEWTFQDGDLSRFDLKEESTQPLQIVDQALKITPSKRPSEVSWQVDFLAADVDTIEIESRGTPTGRIILYWATTPEGQFAVRRQLSGNWSSQDVGSGRLLRLEVADHARWEGRIRRLRLVISPQKQSFTIRAIRGLDLATTPDLAKSLTKKAWKVKLGNDIRNGIVAMPDASWEAEAFIPPRARLRASYGMPSALDASATFMVSGALADGSPQKLFTSTIEASSDGDRWHSATIDLKGHSNETMRFYFDVLLNRELDLPLDDLPLWANPEIVVPGHATDPPNIVLISIDTLRADHLSIYGHDRLTTPGIDSWTRRNAIVFENVVAAAPNTVPAHVSMFTGLNALHHGVNYARPIPDDLATLPEQLRRRGYATYAVTGGGYVRSDIFGRGFDRFRFWDKIDGSEELTSGLTAATTWLEEVNDPFFLFFHTYEVHSPYVAREPHFTRLTQKDSRRFDVKRLFMTNYKVDAGTDFVTHRHFAVSKEHVNLPEPPSLPPELRDLPGYLYDSRLSFADEHVATFLNKLDQSGRLENTVVVITSDHGELLGEHGLAGHLYLYEPNLKIPLIVAAPGLPAGRRISQQVRTTDVAPTILELVGAQAAPGLDGMSLAPLLSGQSARSRRPAWGYAPLTNWGISLHVDNRTKFIFSNNPFTPTRSAHRVYDLKSDPHETTPLDPNDFMDLQDMIAKEFEASAKGVRLRFAGTAMEGFSGRLEGQGLKRWNLKSTDIPCKCLRWTDNNQVLFEVPPKTEYTLFLDGWRMKYLFLTVEAHGSTNRFEHAFRRPDLEDGIVIEWQADGWKTSTANHEQDLRGLEIRLWGQAPSVPETDLQNGDMADQLRALGYLN